MTCASHHFEHEPQHRDKAVHDSGSSRVNGKQHRSRPHASPKKKSTRYEWKPFTPEQLAARVAAIPVISFPDDLPIANKRDDITHAIANNQVVIVAGETGSGKTTQLPKICLQLGRGITGMIGHTQPRRLAARSVAERIAEELGQTVGKTPGQAVGYQVRFTDTVGPTTLIKLMTDGILLAEIQSDPLLRRYDTLIIDEAHERSLNIDFILGYLARLLPARPDLKVIITSATIDTKRFAEHFGHVDAGGTLGSQKNPLTPAPIIEVSGRTYPVEIRYRPLSADTSSTWTSESPQTSTPSQSPKVGQRRTQACRVNPASDTNVASNGSPAADTKLQPETMLNPETASQMEPAAVTVLKTQHLVLENPDDDLPTLGYGLGDDIDQESAICHAVEELCAEGPGDILVFLPGERDIRETLQALAEHFGPRAITDVHKKTGTQATHPNSIELLPLYAGLSPAEQHRIFEPHAYRRVVLATNIAETSLTVPGIHYVIDPGLARISRYSNRTKVQRLPIEDISQASANQRAGRSGRLADGVTIRLYSETDYHSRPRFTEPEIMRTSLASVILQMMTLGLGDIEKFPFIDPPHSRSIRDGVQLLTEIGALGIEGPTDAGGLPPLQAQPQLTSLGRSLAHIPIDPRLGRMLVEGDRNGCASDVLVIVAALSIQDVRMRPLEFQQQADAAHARFIDPNSDFLTYLNLWRYLNIQQRDLSASAFRRLCKSEFLNYLRFREWRDVITQLRQMAHSLNLDIHPIGIPSRARVAREEDRRGISDAAARAACAYTASTSTPDADEIHRSLLVGLLSNIGTWDMKKRDYQGTRDTHFTVWPGSGLAKTHHDWVMSAELVETVRLFARTVARINPQWIENAAGHLVTRVHSEPYWSSSKGTAMIHEKVLLYGLTIIADRTVMLDKVDMTFSSQYDVKSNSSVARPGTLAGIAQGLEGTPQSSAWQGRLHQPTAFGDALSQALAVLGLSDSNESGKHDQVAPGSDAPTPKQPSSANIPMPPTPNDKLPSNSPTPIANSVVDENERGNSGMTATELAREMFIRHALVQGNWRERHQFQRANNELLEHVREIERRSRTHGLTANEDSLIRFFDEQIPENITSASRFNRWWGRQRRITPDLLNYTVDTIYSRNTDVNSDSFPDVWKRDSFNLGLSYEFSPGSPSDGVTMTIPISVLAQVNSLGTDWLVPGMLTELVTETIRSLPKAKRRFLAPASELTPQIIAWMNRRGDNHPWQSQKSSSEKSAKAISSQVNSQDTPADSPQIPSYNAQGQNNDPQSIDAALNRLAQWAHQSGRSGQRSQSSGSPITPSSTSHTNHADNNHADTSNENTSMPAETPKHEAATVASQDSIATISHRHTEPFIEAFALAVMELRGVELDTSDLTYAEEHLPPHLIMNFRVIDKDGKELGSSPSLSYLQSTLSALSDSAIRSAVHHAVSDAFTQASNGKQTSSERRNKRKTHTLSPSARQAPAALSIQSGVTQTTKQHHDLQYLLEEAMTDLPERPLPMTISTHDQSGLPVTAYPALVPRGTVDNPVAAIRLMSNAQDAHRSYRLGLARLLLASISLSTQRITTRWTGRDALMLAASPYATTEDLVADAQWASALSLVDELSPAQGPTHIRSREQFHVLVHKARELHEDRVYDILKSVIQAMTSLAELQQTLHKFTSITSLNHVVEDVNSHVQHLVPDGFIGNTPWQYVPHIARYLRADSIRLQRAARGSEALRHDEDSSETIANLEDAIFDAERRAQSIPYDMRDSLRIQKARWMLEELRVSMFAQQLGTPIKVSTKRILEALTP